MRHPFRLIPFFFLFFFCYFLVGCNKSPVEKPDPVIVPATDEVPLLDKELTTASVQGFVVLEGGYPVFGAAVTCGTNTTTTDAKGYFEFHNIQLSKNNGFVKVNKPGYFTGSRSFLTNNNRNNQVRVQLIPKQINGTIDASAGGTVTLPNGTSLTLPVNSVMNVSDSSLYTGAVNVSMASVDPSNTNLTEQMPGDLRGIITTGEENVLQTFGMATVELTSNSGKLLQITTGKKATLSFSIPSSLATAAPATIPLWYFNETINRWKQDGIATKTGDKYIGTVSHFSFWNLDIPQPLVTFDATIITPDGKPLAYTPVTIIDQSGARTGNGVTDSMGYVSGKIPANKALALQVASSCGDILFSKNIGPYSTNSNLGTITVANSANAVTTTISGTLVDCNNAGISNGLAWIAVGNFFYRAATDNAGKFSTAVSYCSNSTAFSVYGIDNSNNQKSQPVTQKLSASNDVGILNTCSDTSNYMYILVKDTIIDIPVSKTLSGIPRNGLFTVTPIANSGSIDTTTVSGVFAVVGSSKEIRFSFVHTGWQPGTYPITSYHSAAGYSMDYTFMGVMTDKPMVVITEPFDGIGNYVTGHFTLLVNDGYPNPAAIPFPLSCNFKVKRTQ